MISHRSRKIPSVLYHTRAQGHISLDDIEMVAVRSGLEFLDHELGDAFDEAAGNGGGGNMRLDLERFAACMVRIGLAEPHGEEGDEDGDDGGGSDEDDDDDARIEIE